MSPNLSGGRLHKWHEDPDSYYKNNNVHFSMSSSIIGAFLNTQFGYNNKLFVILLLNTLICSQGDRKGRKREAKGGEYKVPYTHACLKMSK